MAYKLERPRVSVNLQMYPEDALKMLDWMLSERLIDKARHAYKVVKIKEKAKGLRNG